MWALLQMFPSFSQFSSHYAFSQYLWLCTNINVHVCQETPHPTTTTITTMTSSPSTLGCLIFGLSSAASLSEVKKSKQRGWQRAHGGRTGMQTECVHLRAWKLLSDGERTARKCTKDAFVCSYNKTDQWDFTLPFPKVYIGMCLTVFIPWATAQQNPNTAVTNRLHVGLSLLWCCQIAV